MDAIRWGIIGAGDIVRKRIAPAIIDLSNCELTAISRNRADLAEATAKEFGARRGYADWHEMLLDIEIDAIYIATPVYLHAEQTIAAADAGKHVLCEKPMAMDTKECEQMIAACNANGVKLGVAYYRRFYPVLERVREVLASGEIGQPVIAQINAFEYVDLAADDPRGWFLQKEKSGGGPMMDFGCHRLEVLTDLFGDATRVESLTANVVFRDRDVEDTAVALLQFPSGVCASVTVTHGSHGPQDTLDVFATKGSIRVAVLNDGEVQIKTSAGERIESHPPYKNIHQPLIEDFADAVMTNREPRVGGVTGRTIAGLLGDIYAQK
jgi:Predicted dehydrogenases and related proteins